MEQQQHRLLKHQQHGCQQQQHRLQNSSNTISCSANKGTQEKIFFVKIPINIFYIEVQKCTGTLLQN